MYFSYCNNIDMLIFHNDLKNEIAVNHLNIDVETLIIVSMVLKTKSQYNS